MEGVGARLGRSSTRYGPATVFTGPVRKWKKKWVPVPPSNSNHNHQTAGNGTVNGASSHLKLYKWTPITPTQNKDSNNYNNGNDNSNDGNADSNKDDDDDVASEEPPRRRIKYTPIILLEEQKEEEIEDEAKPIEIEDEAKPSEIEDEAKSIEIEAANTVETTSKSDGLDEKPDINDVPMDENESQAAPENNNLVERQDLNESTLDLSLDFNPNDGENESDSKADQES